jgi:hypothetical protein
MSAAKLGVSATSRFPVPIPSVGWRSQCPPLQQPACRLSFVERES